MDKSTFFKLLFAYVASVLVVVAILVFFYEAFTEDVSVRISAPEAAEAGTAPPPIETHRTHPLVVFIPLVMCALFLVFLMIGIGIAVHWDARKRGMEAPLVWALVAAVVPYFLGLIVYLIIRKPIQALCGSCGKPVRGTDSFCPHCGQPLRAQCSRCDRPVDPTARFCPHCGGKLAVEQ